MTGANIKTILQAARSKRLMAHLQRGETLTLISQDDIFAGYLLPLPAATKCYELNKHNGGGPWVESKYLKQTKTTLVGGLNLLVGVLGLEPRTNQL